MELWIVYTFICAIFKGFFNCAQKKSAEKNTIYEVLAYFTLIAFLFVAFFYKTNFMIPLPSILVIVVKTLIIVISWILNLYAMSKMPISLYGVINQSRIIFVMILSILCLGEHITRNIFLGMLIVVIGLVLVNTSSDKKEQKESSLKVIFVLLLACFLNACSSVMDKKILLYVTSAQLQFWFLLFLTFFYWMILLIKQRKIGIRSIKNNYWILITAICLVIGDRFIFMATAIPESKISVITIVQQLSAIEMIILGKFMFNERKIIKKILLSILIIIGIMVTLI